MSTKPLTLTQRRRALKLATETVEAELNRLPPPDVTAPRMDWTMRDSFHDVIRYLKARYAALTQEEGTGDD